LDEVWSSPLITKDLLKRKSKLEDIVSHFDALSGKLVYLEESI